VYLSGELVVETHAGVLTGADFPGRQGREVFALLGTRVGTPLARTAIAEELWGAARPPSWDGALSAIVSKLRGALGRVGLDGNATLRASDGCYLLQLPGDGWIDHAAAFDAIHRAEATMMQGDPVDAYAPSAIALHIGSRPFLPGSDAPWIDARRDKLRSVHVRALECRARFYVWNGEHHLAVAAASEALALEPLRESSCRALMAAHAAAGNSAQAMGVYEDCRRRIANELGVAPSPETRELHASILRRL
jgi:SARP family transcriptional regulator, regulator of embCAB operon